MRRRTAGPEPEARPRALPKVDREARRAATHRNTDAGPDRVVCLLCGETYRAITYRHLKRVHGFEGAHPVDEYKARFGLRVASCEETCDLKRDAHVERYKRLGRHWTPARVVREIRRRDEAGHALSRAHAPPALVDAACRLLGSWDAALREAGLDPVEHRIMGVWDESRLVREIRALHAAHGRLQSTWVLENHPEVHGAATRIAGNWGNALRRAGLDPNDHREPPKCTPEDAEAWIRARMHAGKPFTAEHAPVHLYNCVRLKAGMGWIAFVERLGVQYPGGSRRYDWTDADVLKELRRRRDGGRTLQVQEVVEEMGQALPKQAKARFGSWDGALRAAGIDPDSVRPKRGWTRDEVIHAIRERDRRGQPLTYASVVAEDRPLVRAAQKLFLSSWGKALAAAGLDPTRVLRSTSGAARRLASRRKAP